MTALSNRGGGNTAKFPVIGTVHEGVIASLDESQQTEFGTNDPIFWPDGTPKVQVVVTFDTGTRLYVKGGIWRAVSEMLDAEGLDDLAVNGHLRVEYVSDGQRNAKIYDAQYVPPEARA